ncbi:response regulator transcription factor [Schnuerera sp. xch1]|nr:response regulator transcription factor [Schnuerera sp. xch1]MBZ2174502.1 response regulator transcription factor [Schnuerera sp. xch1]
MDLKRKILIVEDEEPIRKLIKINLEREKFIVTEAETGEKALEIAQTGDIDVVILDIMLPGIDGFEVCKKLRNKFSTIGIIMLTAKSQDVDKIMGLEYGTDDYMVKPFNPMELILRIKSLLRRMDSAKEDNKDVIVDDPFKIDKYSRKFYKNNKHIELTPTEYSIMKLFIENPGKAFSRDEILNLIWGYDFIGDTKIVDVNIRRLRSKIETDSKNPYYIETVWGVGYRWRSEKEHAGEHNE